jgi:hypothetical protein
MEQQNYHCSIAANITPKQAYANIANVGAWWTKSFKGKALHVGDTFTVQFGETRVDFEITEAVADKKISWKVTDCNLHWLNDKKEWKDTEIVWEISSTNDHTKIDMTHVGLKPGIECYESCRKGWNQYVSDSLFKLVTSGVGKPD